MRPCRPPRRVCGRQSDVAEDAPRGVASRARSRRQLECSEVPRVKPICSAMAVKMVRRTGIAGWVRHRPNRWRIRQAVIRRRRSSPSCPSRSPLPAVAPGRLPASTPSWASTRGSLWASRPSPARKLVSHPLHVMPLFSIRAGETWVFGWPRLRARIFGHLPEKFKASFTLG